MGIAVGEGSWRLVTCRCVFKHQTMVVLLFYDFLHVVIFFILKMAFVRKFVAFKCGIWFLLIGGRATETYFMVRNNELKGFAKQKFTSQEVLPECVFLFKLDVLAFLDI